MCCCANLSVVMYKGVSQCADVMFKDVRVSGCQCDDVTVCVAM